MQVQQDKKHQFISQNFRECTTSKKFKQKLKKRLWLKLTKPY